MKGDFVLPAILVACGLLAICAFPRPSLGADTPPASALDLVPADAAFFLSWQRQGEQFDILRDSKAFESLVAIPQVRRALGPLLLGEFDRENPTHVTIRQWLSQPSVQVGLDALSHEIFLYGDRNVTELARRSREITAESSRVRLEALAAGKTAAEADRLATQEAIRHLDELYVPSLVVGLKVNDPLRARSQLMLLDGLIHLGMAADGVPKAIRKSYGRERIQGQDFLTLELDGAMLPSGQIQVKGDVNPEIAEMVKAAIRKLKLTVAAGFLGDYALVSIGPSTDHLRRLEQGESLSEHEDLARLKEIGRKPFTSIRYQSAEYRTAVADMSVGLPDLIELAKVSAEDDEELSEDTLREVREALDALKSESQQDRTPRPASLAFTYLTDDGYEGFSYGPALSDTVPASAMSVLLHVGDRPFGVAAYRNWIGTAATYERLSDMLAKAFANVQQSLDDDTQRFLWYEYCGMARRLDMILRDTIVPAIAGGQVAVVFAATNGSRQWHPEMPPSEEPLPLPEAGLVVETHDPVGLLEGLDEARLVVEEAVGLFTSMAQELPPLEMKVEETPFGRVYSLPPWPELTGISPNVLAPSAAVSDRWFALSLRPGMAATLLQPRGWVPPEVTDEQRNAMTGLTHFRPDRLIEIGLAWLEYAEQTNSEELSEEDKMVLATYRRLLELMGCFKSYTRVIYQQDDTSVVHTRWRFEDRQ